MIEGISVVVDASAGVVNRKNADLALYEAQALLGQSLAHALASTVAIEL
jgi:hypothetical protein